MLQKLTGFIIPSFQWPTEEEWEHKELTSFKSGDSLLLRIRGTKLSSLPEIIEFMGRPFSLAGQSVDGLSQRIYTDASGNTLVLSRDLDRMRQEMELYDRNGKDLPTR